MADHLIKALVVIVAVAAFVTGISAESFSTDVDVTYGNANIQENGNQLQLNLLQSGGSEVQSRQQYLYGRFDMQIKAVPEYSAGTVASFFVCNLYSFMLRFELLIICFACMWISRIYMYMH